MASIKPNESFSWRPVEGKAIRAIVNGELVAAATVIGITREITAVGPYAQPALFQVATWEAGRGQRIDVMTPADYATWRQAWYLAEGES